MDYIKQCTGVRVKEPNCLVYYFKDESSAEAAYQDLKCDSEMRVAKPIMGLTGQSEILILYPKKLSIHKVASVFTEAFNIPLYKD